METVLGVPKIQNIHRKQQQNLFTLDINLSKSDSVKLVLNKRVSRYDPGSGRFISADPIGISGGDTNLYRYVLNSPISSIDPLGNFGVYAGYKLQGVIGLGEGAGISTGVRSIYGTEKNRNVSATITQGQIPQEVVGMSAGRGFEVGVFLLDVSAFENAKETSLDTPLGGITIFSNSGFISGVGISGPSFGVSYQSTSPGESPSIKKGGLCE